MRLRTFSSVCWRFGYTLLEFLLKSFSHFQLDCLFFLLFCRSFSCRLEGSGIVGPWYLGRESRSLIIKGVSALPSQQEGHLTFIFQHEQSLFLVTVPFSLTIKADVQYMFVRPQTGYFN